MSEDVAKLYEELAEIKCMLMNLTVAVEAISKAKMKKATPDKKSEVEELSNVVYFPESAELEEKFREFMEYRRTEKHNSMGLQSIKRTVAVLKKFTVKESITALDEAMRNGYTGVFPKHISDSKGKSNQSVAEAWGNA